MTHNRNRMLIMSMIMVLALSLVAIGCPALEEEVADVPVVEPIVIGVPTSLGFIEGKESLQAVKMAVEEINARGGVLVYGERRPLTVVSIDARGAAPGVPTAEVLMAYEKLILEHEPTAILVGTFRSEALLAVMDIIAEHRIIHIGTIAMTPRFEARLLEDYERFRYMFRLCVNARQLVMYLTGVMDHLNNEFGFNRVFLMPQDVLWARATLGGVESWLKEHGWEVVGHEPIPTGTTDFSVPLLKAKAGGAQVIMPMFDMPESGIALMQHRAMKIPALLAGFISPAMGEGAWEAFDGEVEGVINVIFEAGNMPVEAIPESLAFFERFRERWGVALESGHGPSPAYDSVHVLAAAIERAGTLEPGAVADAIKETDMMGAIGRIRFGHDHQAIYGLSPKEGALSVAFQWQYPGVRVPVFPTAVAEGVIKLPHWMPLD